MYEFLEYEVRDVMSKPTTVRPEASLAEIEQLLEKTGFNGVPVVGDGGKLVGFVTSLDLLEAFRFGTESILPQYDDIMRKHVSSVMQQLPATVTPRMRLSRLLERMVETRNKSFPVVDPHTDGLVGVVAREDLMRALRRAQSGARPDSPDANRERAQRAREGPA
jgi:CBS-domain-containing membrane protein